MRTDGTANDPTGDHFKGGVITNGGSSASATNGTVQASGLVDVRDGGADRLRCVLFEGASGSITNLRVPNINQGASGCLEWNGSEVRNAPFDSTGPDVVCYDYRQHRHQLPEERDHDQRLSGGDHHEQRGHQAPGP